MEQKGWKKHHFWILLSLAIVLVPISCMGTMFSVGGQAQERAKKIEDEQKSLKGQTVKSDGYREQLDAQKTELQAQKTRVWKEAYKAQDGLIQWPQALSHLNTLAEQNKLFFGDPINDQDRNMFMQASVYLGEYDRLPDVILPTEFPERNWRSVLRYVTDFKTMPTPEEVWLALEDLCVQREVLRDIHAVNQMLAEFLPVPMPPKEPAKPKGAAAEEKKRYDYEWGEYLKKKEAYDAAKRKVDDELKAELKPQSNEHAFRFISPYWQLDIVAGRPAGGKAGELAFRGKLTNTSPRRQNVAEIGFRVWLTDPKRSNAEYVVLPVQAEYLAAGASVDFAATRTGQADPSLTIYKVEQKLDTRYVPVKRLDVLRLDYPSNRFAGKGLVAAAVSDDAKKNAPAPPPPSGPTLGTAANAAAPNLDNTPNGIPRLRYLERTEQVRRMPVAMVMIVDQAHVQDVLRALSNSRLRFQNTQVHYERFRGVISLEEPSPIGELNTPATAPPTGAPAGGSRMKPRGDDMVGGLKIGLGGPGGRGPGGEIERGPRQRPPTGGYFPTPSHGDVSMEEENNNLVELTVYGLISLYERFPPRSPADQAGGSANSATAAPASVTAPPPPPPPNAPFVPPQPAAGTLPAPPPPGPNPTATPPAKPPGSP
jgi:hypothetical protein